MIISKLKLFGALIVLATIFGCKNKLENDDVFIRNLSNDKNFVLPLHNESIQIFINKNDTIYIKSLRQLHNIKAMKYKNFNDFDYFLIKVINEEILKKSDLKDGYTEYFKLNYKLLNELNKVGLVNFKIKYCDNSNMKNKFYIKNNLTYDKVQNLMYIFFKSNYYVMSNDYSGKYIVIDKNI